jgi:hypothetical protein
MFLFSLLFSFVLFLWGRGSVCPGGYAGLSQGWLWEYCVPLICSPVVLLDVSQAGLELVSGGALALLFSQCNVVRRNFVWAGGSGCWSFNSPWCFISALGGCSISARFLIYGAHAVYFYTLVTILDPIAFSICTWMNLVWKPSICHLPVISSTPVFQKGILFFGWS